MRTARRDNSNRSSPPTTADEYRQLAQLHEQKALACRERSDVARRHGDDRRALFERDGFESNTTHARRYWQLAMRSAAHLPSSLLQQRSRFNVQQAALPRYVPPEFAGQGGMLLIPDGVDGDGDLDDDAQQSAADAQRETHLAGGSVINTSVLRDIQAAADEPLPAGGGLLRRIRQRLLPPPRPAAYPVELVNGNHHDDDAAALAIGLQESFEQAADAAQRPPAVYDIVVGNSNDDNAAMQQDDDDADECCCICLDNPRTMTVRHAGSDVNHTVVCEACALTLRDMGFARCPLCREPIEAIVRASVPAAATRANENKRRL